MTENMGRTATRTARLYLPHPMDERARRGEHNFVNQLTLGLKELGFDLEIITAGPLDTLVAAEQEEHALFLMQEPQHTRGLNLRVSYVMPFWRIERTAERWRFDVAAARFQPDAIDPAEARRFADFWARRKFGDAPARARRDGFVYVPLQGHVTRQRSFQAASPVDMLRETLQRTGGRGVMATLHPKEKYSPREMAELEALAETYPQLEISTGQMEKHLEGCDFIVTQNSSAALMGLFFKKPSILFAQVDFHHPMLNVADIGLDAAFVRVQDHRPDWVAYLLWFLKMTSINAGAPDAPQQVAQRLRALGWGE